VKHSETACAGNYKALDNQYDLKQIIRTKWTRFRGSGHQLCYP